jgi:hypothetical protein
VIGWLVLHELVWCSTKVIARHDTPAVEFEFECFVGKADEHLKGLVSFD